MSNESDLIGDVVGIGNAIVDIVASAAEPFLAKNGMVKGSMVLIGSEQAHEIHEAMSSLPMMSGGSVGNTMAALASLGGKGSYVGKVHKDALGKVFRDDLTALGINFSTEPNYGGSPTGSCLVIVTPDGQRSMATYLGACVELGPEDIDEETIRRHRITYLEGYLWDAPRAKEAMIRAATLASRWDRKVALTLSDAFCVDRHRASFRQLIQNHVDILFANEEELVSLYPSENIQTALAQAIKYCSLVAITSGEKGSLIASEGVVYQVDAVPVELVIDTTGAGDLYAAGLLFGITHGYDIQESGYIAALVASEIISHVGARSATSLRDLIRAQGVAVE